MSAPAAGPAPAAGSAPVTTGASRELAAATRLVLRAQRPGLELLDLRPLTSGASGLTLLGRARESGAQRSVVVKTIPAGLAPVRNRDLARQVRVLRHLRRVGAVPVPEVVAFDPGTVGDQRGDPAGSSERPPLYVMSHIEGSTVDPTNPGAADRCPAAELTARSHAAIRTLVALQAVDVSALGEPALTLEDEVTRWQRALSTTDGAHRAPAEELLDRLRATRPAPLAPVLSHGDYRLGNLLFQGREVAAVLDWEIWSIADPRLDLAWFVARAVGGHPSLPDPAWGFPSAEALLRSYGPRPAAFDWFLATAALKHAAASALIDKRSTTGRDPARVGRLVAWAISRLDRDQKEISVV